MSWLAVGGDAVAGTGRAVDSVASNHVSTPSVVVTVQEGESLWLIAQRVFPDRDPREVVWEIRTANDLRSNMIHPGQVLAVPTSR